MANSAPFILLQSVEEECSVAKQASSSASVKVMGMETVTGHDRGQRWSPRPETPPAVRPPSRTMTSTPPPSEIYLEGSLPKVHQLLVSESEVLIEHLHLSLFQLSSFFFFFEYPICLNFHRYSYFNQNI